jgi:hypothetical protein
MEIADSMATQMDQMENEVSMTQTDKELVEFYLEDDSSFIEVTAETKKSLDTIEKEGLCKSSAAQTENAIKRFKTFLRDHKLSESIETIPVRVLNDYLRSFYSELRRGDGEYLSPTTLSCIRAGIHRYLTGSNVNRPINILVRS